MRPIVASRTNEIISYVRIELNDLDYKLVKTNDELFYKGLKSIRDIALFTKRLIIEKTFLTNESKFLYSPADIGITDYSINHVVEVVCLDNNKILESLSYNDIRLYNERGTSPSGFSYELGMFKFVPITHGALMKVVCSVLPNLGASMWYDREPPLPPVYDQYIGDGIIYQVLASQSSPIKNPAYYLGEFNKFKEVSYPALTHQAPTTKFNELNTFNY